VAESLLALSRSREGLPVQVFGNIYINHNVVSGSSNIIANAQEAKQHGFMLEAAEGKGLSVAPPKDGKQQGQPEPEIVATATDGARQEDFSASQGRIKADASKNSSQRGFSVGQKTAPSEDGKFRWSNPGVVAAIIGAIAAIAAAIIGVSHNWWKKDEPPAGARPPSPAVEAQPRTEPSPK